MNYTITTWTKERNWKESWQVTTQKKWSMSKARQILINMYKTVKKWTTQLQFEQKNTTVNKDGKWLDNKMINEQS